MDLNLIRSLLTLLLFIAFVALIILLMLRGKGAYEQAANLPFVETDHDDE
jgi:cbb3-type cytochrome oxidase subunit 3